MRPLLVTAIAGSVLALSACGGGAEPPEAAPPSSSGTPSGSASPSASGTPEAEVTLPAEAQGFSTEAAREVVRLFLERTNEATVSGDTRGMRQLYVEDCENCESIADKVDAIYEDGGSIEGKTWDGVTLSEASKGPNGRLGVIARATPARQVVKMTSTSAPQTSPARQEVLVAVTLVRGDAGWSITTMNIEDAAS